MINLVGNLKDIYGGDELAGSLNVQLCGFGSQIPRISGTGLLARTAPLAIACPAGTYNFSVYANDIILPAGTYYSIQVLDRRGSQIQTNNYQFAGAGVYDISALAPYAPPPPISIPANPVLLNPAGLQTINGSIVVVGSFRAGYTVVAYAANPVFDASLGNTFDITLTGNVAGSTVPGVNQGQIVTFIIVQDAVGGRTFVWPAVVKNAGEINPIALGVSVQSFIVRAGGNLYPIGPMTFS